MKKTARNILLIVVAVLLLAAFAGCKPQTPVASGTLQVNTIKIMPYAYMGEEFDLREVLLMEEGVEYSATACYVDLDTMTEYTLEVNDLCFTPVAVQETVVVITANRGKETAAKVIYIPTTIRAEPLDDLYKSSGSLGGSDPGITKTVNIDPLYLYGDESTTSLHVSFNSTDPHPYGNLFMSFSAEAAQQYFTDQVWENAIVTFWVYNPSELPVEFQLRIVDEEAGTNLDWQTVDGPHKQRAEPGQWTQVFFSLRKLGTTHRLTGGKYSNEMLSLKFRYDGYSTTDAYSFDFYMDNIDIVDASMYPEIDTKYVLSNETIEQGWENMAMDTGWQGVYTEYDYETIQGEGSTCSLKAYFNSEKSLTNSFICLSPEAEFDENPDMTGGILSGYFKFEGLDPKVSVDIVNKAWETSNRVDMKLQALGDGWYYGTLDLEELQVGTGRNDQIIRIRLNFSGVTNSSIVYVDTLIYEYKYVEKVLEYADVDLINMSLDTGSYYCNLKYSYVTSPIIGSNTVRSLKLVAPANTNGRFTWNTSTAADKGELSSIPNMSYGTLGAWFYFGKQLPNASFQVTSDNWKGSTAIPFVFTKNNGDGWYYGELHGSDIKFVESANAKEVIRWTLIIPEGYTVCVDNLSWTTSYENALVAAEIDPSVLFDGGDLLAGTDKISYDKRHWENVDNTDDFDKDGVVDPDLTKGLTCGVDTKNVYGEFSVRSWYFKAAADNNFGSAVAQLKLAKAYDMTGKNLAFDIKIDSDSKVQQAIGLRLQTAGWANINEQNVTVKLNPGDWRTVVVDFSDVLLENADVANLGFISLYFDFAANTGKDRVIYIDNVRLTTDAATGDEKPLPLGPEDQFDGGDLLANTNTVIFDKTHWDNIPNSDDDRDGQLDADKTKGLTTGVNTDASKLYGQYSVRNWYFKAVAANNYGNAIAQMQLAQTYDLTGKNLAFDILVDTECKFQQPIGIRLNNSGWANINEQNVNIKVNPGQWKHVVVSFDDVILENVDITTLGFISFYFDFAATSGFDRTIYIDNVVLTTEEPTAQEAPMVKEDNAENDWTNMVQDKGEYYCNVESVIRTDKVKGEISTKSLYVKAPADAAGKLTFNTGYAVEKGELAKTPNMNAGILGAWFYFGENEPAATVKVTESFGWKGSAEAAFMFGEGEDGWYYGTVDCSTITYAETSNPGYAIRVTIGVPAGFEGYIDSMTFEPGEVSEPVEPETTEPVVMEEDLGDLLADCTGIVYNKDHWVEANGLSVGQDTSVVYGDQSTRSWAFKASAAANMVSAVAQFDLGQSYDMTGKNLAFDIKIDANSKLQQNIGVRLHNTGWSNLNDHNQNVKLNPGEWKTVVMNFESLLNEGKDFSDLHFVSFYFNFAANTGKDRVIYIDNVRLTTDAATGDDEPLPLGPEDQIDGGDLLAGTDVLEYNRNHWENISNTHDLNGDGVADDHVTAGLTVNVDNTHLNGQYSVRSWKFHAAADANFNNATAQFKLANTLDISNKKLSFDVYYDAATKVQQSIRVRLHSKSTGDMFADQTVKVNPGQWKTVVMDFTGTLLEGKVATDLQYVSFYFDFAANSGKERAVYIDNVQLVDMSVPTVGSDEPLPLDPADQYDGGDLLANATAADKTGIFAEDKFSYDPNSTNICNEGAVGEYSVKSWKFSAAPGESGYPTALIQLPESVNMTGKVLALDAFIENGNGSVSIYTIHNSSWGRLNESETAANYRNETITGQWVTLYYDLGSKLAEGKDLTDVKFIKFQFSFKENMTVEQAVYIDNVRLVDPADVPPADDVSLDWTNMAQDKGAAAYHNMLTNEFVGSHVKGENSIKSLHLVAPAEAEGRFTLHTEAARINGELSELPDVYAGILGAWFYFGDNEPSAKIQITDGNWKTSVEESFTFGEGENGWYYGTVDGSQIMFTQTNAPELPIRMTIILPAGFDGYMDSMTMIPTETVEDDWIKMFQDVGPAMCNVETAFNTEYLKVENSLQSLYIQAPAEEAGMVTFNTQLAFGKNFDMTSGQLGAWFYFGEQAMSDIYVKLNGNNKASNLVAFEYIAGDEGWAYGVIDMYDFTYAEAEGTSANTLRVSVIIPAGYSLYMDGFTYDPQAATEGSEAGTDLLGNAAVEAPDWIEENGLIVKQDSAEVIGMGSVRSWSFKASAAVNTEAAVKFDLGENVNMTNCYLLFDAKSVSQQNLTVQLLDEAGEAVTGQIPAKVATADWTNYLVNIPSDITAGKNVSAVRYVVFSFNFASNTGADRSIYIDNVDLLGAETAEQDWIHKEQITGEGFKTADLSLSYAFSKAEDSWVSLKVEAPADASGKFTLNIADGMKHRGTLGAWFYFGEQSPSARIITVEAGGNVSQAEAFSFGEGEDGWYYGTADLSAMVYEEGVNRALINKITLQIPASYVVYIDGLRFTDITETVADDLINLSNSVASGAGSYEYTEEIVKDDNSVHSLRATATVNVNFLPEAELDLRNTTFSCWLYFGENTPTANAVRFAFYDGTANTGYIAMTIDATGENGWYRATVDTSAVASNRQAALAAVDKIVIQFRSDVCMDYLTYASNETSQ